MRFLISILFLLVSYIGLGQISGKVIDQDLNGIPFVSIYVIETKGGTTTDFDGNFKLNLPDEKYTIVSSFIGFDSDTLIINSPSSDLTINLKSSAISLKAVNIVSERNIESEVALMELRKSSTISGQNISVKELSKKGISNISDGLNKVVGVSIQDQINVRGLGDRYNQVSLNHLPLPSSNPDLKNIDLNLLDKDFMSSMNIYKTYNSNLWGESTGSQFNINTKQITKKESKIKLSTSWNSFNNKLSPTLRFNTQFVKNNHKLYFNLKSRTINDYREGTISDYNAQQSQILNYEMREELFSTNNSGGLIYIYDRDNYKIESISLGTHIYNLSQTETYGEHFDYPSNLFTIRNSPSTQLSVIQQINSEYNFNLNHSLKLKTQYSIVKSGENDRTQNVFLENDGEYIFNRQDFLDNHRFNNSHVENQFIINPEYSYNSDNSDVIFGVMYNNVIREFDYTQNYFINLPNSVIEEIGVEDNFQEEVVNDPSSNVDGGQKVYSIYFQNTHKLNRLNFFYGLRIDRTEQVIKYIDQLQLYDKVIYNVNNNFLPNIGIKYNLDEKKILKGSYSRTIIRPRFRELTPFEYTRFFASVKQVGNPELMNSLSDNFDISIEYFIDGKDLIAVSFFYKNINNPIEQVFIPTASGRLMTFDNSKSAKVYGVEFEYRKDINKFTFDINTTLMGSVVELDENNISTNKRRPLQGSTPLILNIDLLYNLEKSSFGILYNRNGNRLFSLGVQGMEDVYQTPFNNINLVYKREGKVDTRIRISNILSNDYVLLQESNVVRSIVIAPMINIQLEYKF